MTKTIDALVEALTLIRGKHGCGALTLPMADLDRVDAALAQARAEQSNSAEFDGIKTTPPAAPVAKPSRFGSPELQTMILANLSTAPVAKLEPLTDAEIDAIWGDQQLTVPQKVQRRVIARALEAAHNAKLGGA